MKLVDQLETTEEKKHDNIYEEIIPMEKKIVRSNSLFFSISPGRREQLQLHKFTGWDMEEEKNKMNKAEKVQRMVQLRLITFFLFQDNYIHPQAIKQQLEDKVKDNILTRRKSRESKSVTFNIEDRKLVRSKSVNPSSHRGLYSVLNHQVLRI